MGSQEEATSKGGSSVQFSLRKNTFCFFKDNLEFIFLLLKKKQQLICGYPSIFKLVPFGTVLGGTYVKLK